MADKAVLYIVKSTVAREHADAFNRWYHEKHIPEIEACSGCKVARRFEAIDAEDRFVYMAVYEFQNREVFMKYQQSGDKTALVEDYKANFAAVSELKMSSWEQIFP